MFKNSLRPGGIYVIEDWGTGYWPHYPDGKKFMLDKNHVSTLLHKDATPSTKRIKKFPNFSFGMVGVIKQLIDEIGIDDATNSAHTSYGHQVNTLIDKIEIHQGIALLFKKP